jgi:transposase
VEEEGLSTREAGTRWQVSHNCVAQWVRRKRSTGSVAAKQRGGGKQSVLEGYKTWLLGRIARKSELTLKEMQALLLAHHGQRVGITTLWGFLKREKIRFKKK